MNVNGIKILFPDTPVLKLIILVCMLIISSILEVVGIGAVFPIVGTIIDPDSLNEDGYLNTLYKYAGFNDPIKFIQIVIVMFVLLFFTKNIYIWWMHRYINMFFAHSQRVLSTILFANYISRNYCEHMSDSKSEIISNLTSELNALFGGFLMPALYLFSETILLLMIIVLLLYVEPIGTAAVVVLMSLISLIIILYVKNYIGQLGKNRNEANVNMVQIINNAIDLIKVIKVSHKEKRFIDMHKVYSAQFNESNALNSSVSVMPKLVLEVVAVISVLLLFYLNKGNKEVIATLALFGMAMIRVLPSFNKIVVSINQLKYNKIAYAKIYGVVNKIPNQGTKYFHNIQEAAPVGKITEIKLSNIKFSYGNTSTVNLMLDELNLRRGEVTALVGRSGSGKTTLVDILLQLLEPQEGNISVNNGGVSTEDFKLYSNIGYVTQSLSIVKGTIAENIALEVNRENVDEDKVWKVIGEVGLRDYVLSLDKNIDAIIGEGAIQMSGGQSQRLSIARALYSDPLLLVMDEPTASLDPISEANISKLIDKLKSDRIIVIIAHRLNTVRSSDNIVYMENGKVCDSGKYMELYKRCKGFQKLVDAHKL